MAVCLTCSTSRRGASLSLLPLFLIAGFLGAVDCAPLSTTRSSRQLNGVVFFPGYSASRLKVSVSQQNFSSSCPKSYEFEFYSGHLPSFTVPERCMFEALRVVYNPSKPSLSQQFSSLPGVTVQLANQGSTLCAPLYFPFYLSLLLSAGYTSGSSLFVACYDYRMAPSVDVAVGPTFMETAQQLVEQAFKGNGRQKVFLISHSNGGPMVQAFLNYMPQKWVDAYIAGFISYAGNWAGQGSFVSGLFYGYSFTDFSTPVPEAALVAESWPAVYYSISQPKVYGKSEVVIKVGNTTYTPIDYQKLFSDAGLVLAQKLLPLFNGFTSPSDPPMVNVMSIYSSGLQTVVGAELAELKRGSAPVSFVYKTGDGNQEDTDNESNLGWGSVLAKHRFCFRVVKLEGVEHTVLPFSLQASVPTMQVLRAGWTGCQLARLLGRQE